MLTLICLGTATAAPANDFAAFGKARVAAANGNVTIAAEQYRIALTAAPDSQIIAQRAFRQAMAAGDLVLARQSAATLGANQPYDAKVLALADALKNGDARQIETGLAGLDKTPVNFFIPIVRAWMSVGKAQDATALPDGAKETGAVRHLILENRALLLLARRDIPAGARALEGELRENAGGLDFRYAAAELLKAAGQNGLARQLLAGTQPEVASVRDRLQPATVTTNFGVSRLFTRIAADLNDANTSQVAVTLTRAALVLDPANDRARILLAGALKRLNANDRALAVLGEIGPSSAFRSLAQAARVEVLRDRGDTDAAILAAKNLANAPDADSSIAQLYGNLLLTADRPLEAAVAYETARDRLGSEAGWQIWLQIASAYEQADRWTLARAAFEQGLALGPDSAVLLNYYGYALTERGEDMPRAVTMLEKANNLAPGQPAIADSLALAYFRRGDVDKALPLLESASLKSPADPEIAEHLGDVYWATGRRYEARYSWRAARLVAEPGAARRLDAKILDGPATVRS